MNDKLTIEYNKNNDQFFSEFIFSEEYYDVWIAQFQSFADILKLMKYNKNMTFQQASAEIFGLKMTKFTKTNKEVTNYEK